MKTLSKPHKLSILAMMTTLALILSYIDSFIIPTVILGAKLGLANIITLVVLVLFGLKEVLAILLLRISIMAVLFTSAISFVLSLSAGLVSLFVMYFLLNLFKGKYALISVSIMGAVFHNLTQIIVVVFIFKLEQMVYLLPLLVLVAILTGLIIGILAIILIRLIKRSVPGLKS